MSRTTGESEPRTKRSESEGVRRGLRHARTAHSTTRKSAPRQHWSGQMSPGCSAPGTSNHHPLGQCSLFPVSRSLFRFPVPC